MIAAVLRKFGQPLAIEQVADPIPGPDDVVIRVVCCGIDGTDLKLLEGFGYAPALPFIMGHEPAGVVERVGRDVRDWRPGDRVIPYIFVVPPQSRWFQSAREQLCPEMLGVLGVKQLAGGYAECLCVPAAQLVRIPETVSFADAAVLCDAGLAAWHAVQRSRVQPGETVLVIGVGGVGGFAVQFAKSSGAHVFAVERGVEKVEFARRMGADEAFDHAQIDLVDVVRQRTAGQGCDCVIDVVGSCESLSLSMQVVALGGRIVVVGYTPDQFPLNAKQVAQQEIELIGSRGGSRMDLANVMSVVSQGLVQSIVSQSVPLVDVNAALARLRSGHVLGRIVLQVRSE